MGKRGASAGTILHLDMDAFFAAVELLDRPELRGKPVVVGAPPDQRGVVSTANYEARVYGIHSAMPSRTAGKLCPHAVFLPVRMSRYLAVSGQLMTLLERYTPLVEPISVDEAFLDVRGVLRRWDDSVELARALKAEIRKKLGLTASVGVAPNKFLAKLASDLEKPDGLTVVPVEPEAIRQFLEPLPVTRIWGVGAKLEKRLRSMGIRHIGDLQRHDLNVLRHELGPAMAEHVYTLAFGRDERPIVTETEAKSISSEHTFGSDCSDPDRLKEVLIELTEHVGHRLRRAGRRARVGHIKLRYNDFSTLTRQQQFGRPTDTDRAFLDTAMALFERERRHRPIRLVGFGVSGLCAPEEGQPPEDLFPDVADQTRRDRDARLDQAVDKLRETYGRGALRRGWRRARDAGAAEPPNEEEGTSAN